jgi:glycosyltransferase involved in cell wall biosynthesis
MAAKRNVLLLADSFEMGGAEGQILLLARLLLKGGRYGVHLACLRRHGLLLDEAERLGVGSIPEFPLTSFYDWNMGVQLRRFHAFLREREVSVVHTEGFYTNVFGITGAALARVPARVAFRGETGGWRTPQQNLVERSVFRMASVVHANSEAVKQFLIDEGVPAPKIAVVHNGLDISRVTPPRGLSRADALAVLGLPQEGNRRFVTIVANMRHDVKDHPMFLRAARRVREALPHAAFILAGEGELMDQLRALARELGLERDTFFTGRCDKMAELLFISEVCVLSSKAEGFSNSILEYMGAARPVVVTDVGGAREAVVEGETGYLVRSGDEETMATRIIALLRETESAHAMGQRGLLVVEQKFSSQAQLERTQELYDQLLAKAQTSGLRRVFGSLHGSTP